MSKIRDIPATPDTRAAARAGTVRIGNDRVVNRMGYGAMRVTGEGVWGPPRDRDGAIAVLRATRELGIQFIDTADAYGPDVSETLIAQALHPYPEELVIATKGGLVRPGPGQWEPDARPERLKACAEASLKRLRLETIGLYQLHRPDPKVPFEEQIGALKELREEGKIEHVGLCNVSLDELRAAERIVPIASVQNRYNIAYRGESEAIIDYCERNGLGFLPWFPLGAGTDDVAGNTEVQIVAKEHGVHVTEIALAWLLHRSPAMLPIPGTSSVEHLRQNTGAAAIELTREDRVRLGLLTLQSTHHGVHDER